ncbi:lysylphosphatidylglycerol synthase transmembrane domain-containing protein [Halovulum sp. GXIMD14794]
MRRRLPLFRFVATLGVLALLWATLDMSAVAEALARADLRWLLLGGLALIVQTLLSAARWRLTAARLGQRITRRHAVSEYFLAQILNQSLPGGVLGDAGRAVRGRSQAGLGIAAQAVVFERLAGQLGLLALFAAGLFASLLAGSQTPVPQQAALLCLGGLGVAGIAVGAIAARAVPRVAQAFREAVLNPDVLPRQAALSLGTAACNLAAFAFCARAVGVHLTWLDAVTLVPLILLTMVLPVTISGWGLREGTAAALLPLAGVAPPAAFAASVAFGLTVAASSLPGLLPLARGRPTEAETTLDRSAAKLTP